MRLLISEFICGGGLANHALPESLKQEGLMMLQALVADCSEIDDCQIVTSLDPRIQLQNVDIEVISITDSKNYLQQIQANAENADFVWIVAPESEGILASVVNALQNLNCIVLNCSVEAIRITADKIKCAELLQSAGLPVIPHIDYSALTEYAGSVVIKPRFGCGSENLCILENGEQAKGKIDEPEKWVVQPHVKGRHLSLSLLCWQGQAEILTCNTDES